MLQICLMQAMFLTGNMGELRVFHTSECPKIPPDRIVSLSGRAATGCSAVKGSSTK